MNTDNLLGHQCFPHQLINLHLGTQRIRTDHIIKKKLQVVQTFCTIDI